MAFWTKEYRTLSELVGIQDKVGRNAGTFETLRKILSALKTASMKVTIGHHS